MSLHAPMTPTARALLLRQQRRTKAISLVLAVFGTTTAACVMGLLFLPSRDSCGCHGTPYIIPPQPTCHLPTPKNHAISSKPTPPSNLPFSMLGLATPSGISMPLVEASPIEPSTFGIDGDFGLGMGNDNHSGWGGPSIPFASRKRCDKADRLELLEQGGADTDVDETVIQALRYLKSTQANDGSWGEHHKSAMTGLALLAYLGHCETAISEEFGDSCLKAITYLVDIGMKNQNRLVADASNRHWPYEQAIATYALAEAETFHRALSITIPMLRETVAQSGQFIIDHQHPSGGWDYSYDKSSSRGGDLSITGWHIQALKACKHTMIDFRNLKPCVRNALNYVGDLQASNGGFGYTGIEPAAGATGASLTGVGMTSFQIWGKDTDPSVRRGANYAGNNLSFDWNTTQCDLYAHYYLSQAIFRRGGPDWQAYQTEVLAKLPSYQSKDGSWPIPGGGQKPEAVGALFAEDTLDGAHYRTTLTTLMLEVYYRYLPSTP